MDDEGQPSHFVAMVITNLPYTSEVESRTQGSRPRPRTQKNFDAKAKNRPSRGQGQEHKKISTPRPRTDPLEPRPRTKDTDASALQKKSLQKFFSGDLYLRKPKKRSLQIFRKVSGVFQRNFNGSKNSAVLEPRTDQFSRT